MGDGVAALFNWKLEFCCSFVRSFVGQQHHLQIAECFTTIECISWRYLSCKKVRWSKNMNFSDWILVQEQNKRKSNERMRAIEKWTEIPKIMLFDHCLMIQSKKKIRRRKPFQPNPQLNNMLSLSNKYINCMQ